jgi:MoaA/NifB/PqqE/SkfB family radical SAM enzyme
MSTQPRLDLSNSPSIGRAERSLGFLWLELTGKCNLRCKHCYADSNPDRPLYEQMSDQDWLNTIDQAASLGCRALQFIGGEPTMHPALPALIERARVRDFETVEVYTNGTMFHPRVKEAFIRHQVDLAFSVYAANSEIHDRVTQRRGSFERTLQSIRWALEARLSVRAGIITMSDNAGETERTQELLRAIGITNIGTDRVRGVGRGSTQDDRSAEAQIDELCGACADGKLAVTASGQIFPCVFSRFWPVGHVRETLQSAIEGVPLIEFTNRMANTPAGRKRKRIPDCPPNHPCKPQCRPNMDCEPLWPCDPLLFCTPDLKPPKKRRSPKRKRPAKGK